MMYRVTASVMITVEDLLIDVGDDGATSEEHLREVAFEMLNKRMTILDVKGARSGDDGTIHDIDVNEITNWNAE